MMRDERNDDKPPYSRLFIVCNKHHREEDLRPLFEAYGEIEELHVPKDRTTGESKGIAYIKYSKTSSAAAAIEHLNKTLLQNSTKPIKVMVSSNKREERNDNENRYKRLFIKVSKESTESDIKEHFSKFGKVPHVRLQKDRETNECRGFAYVNYDTFLEAATAFEECDKKYKPVFAIPKDDLKRTRNFENVDRFPSSDSVYMRDDIYHNFREVPATNKRDSILPLIKTLPKDFDTIIVSCSPCVSQKPLEGLFNIIPGMIKFKFTSDNFIGISKAFVKYDSKVAAAHAVETLNNYVFPSGEIISVKPEDNSLSRVASNLTNIVNSFKNSLDGNTELMQLADAIAQASSLIKAATSGADNVRDESPNESFCNVKLPSIKPLANTDSKVAQRCFLVFKPHTLPTSILQDVFCRFGNLIDVCSFANKTFGFAKYASAKSAQEAMKTLNGATVHGVKLKVLEAEDKPNKDEKMLDDDNSDYNDERKRAKFEGI